MPRNPNETTSTLSIRVERYAHGGDGVATVEHLGQRRAVFLPRTCRGDLVQAKVDFETRPARAEAMEVLEASDGRQTPPCAHFATCGGCNWMHLSAAERAFGLRALASEVQADLPNITAHTPSPELAYRTRARLHIESTRKGAMQIGFFREGSHTPVAVANCVALHPALERARRGLASLLEGANGRGEAQIALGSFAHTSAARRAVLELTFSRDLPGSTYRHLEESIQSDVGVWAGARVTTKGMNSASVIGDPTPWTRGGDDLPLELAPGGFAQASEEGNAFLAQVVDRLARSTGAKRVVELYSGAGNFTVLLARWAERLTAVEVHEGSNAACRRNLAARQLRAQVVTVDAATYEIARDVELVVIDPPRTGAFETAKRLAVSKVKWIVYVSCDTRTLQRDLEILAARYHVVSFDTVDLFPQTSHCESVVLLSCDPIHRPS